MNNKGFIATSIMYSFFIVFALMCLSILGTYSHYRTLNVNLNKSIKNELIDKIMEENLPKMVINATNGNISPNTFSLSNGESKQVTITPNSGYYIKSGTCGSGYSLSGLTTGLDSTSSQTVTINSSSDSGGTCEFIMAKPTVIIKNGVNNYSFVSYAVNENDLYGNSHGNGGLPTISVDGNALKIAANSGSNIASISTGFDMSKYSYLNVEAKSTSNIALSVDSSLQHHWQGTLISSGINQNKITSINISSINNSTAYVAFDTWSSGVSYIVNLWLDEI